jgi:hypothetical protein
MLCSISREVVMPGNPLRVRVAQEHLNLDVLLGCALLQSWPQQELACYALMHPSLHGLVLSGSSPCCVLLSTMSLEVQYDLQQMLADWVSGVSNGAVLVTQLKCSWARDNSNLDEMSLLDC